MDELAAVIRPPEAPGDRYLNRELSWLDWDRRCLELAEDESWPLLERVRMCSIVAATLDEFFMIRVAGLEGQIAAGLAVRSADGRTPAVVLAEIRERVIALRARQVALWQRRPDAGAARRGHRDLHVRGLHGGRAALRWASGSTATCTRC